MSGRREASATRVGVALLATGALTIAVGHIHQHGLHWAGLLDEVYANLGIELAGMAVVILLVDRFASRREDARQRRQLIRELASADRGLTARAVLELEDQGWLHDGTLAGAQLSGAFLAGARLERAFLDRAALAGADLAHANLSGARLRQANLTEARAEAVNLEMADLTGAVLLQADLRGADAALGVFEGADLAGANLTNADLTGADLREADLRGTDLTLCRLGQARLDRVRWDHATRWPAGFEPPLSAESRTADPR